MWSPQQEKALDAVSRWYKSRSQPVFKLFGYAGTGKTTLAKHFAEAVGGRVLFAAYTGKAAHVLQEKGCPATTIHSLIYTPKDKSKKRLQQLELELLKAKEEEQPKIKEAIRVEKENLKRPMFVINTESALVGANLLIVDECSMVDENMGNDLLSFNVPILVLGDPAQLPPVKGTGFFTQDKPDLLLTEIHRQAKDNPILWLANEVRHERQIPLGQYGECTVAANDKQRASELVLASDQILVGKNLSRYKGNMRMRELLGVNKPYPQAGEKLVCLRNNAEIGLLNGGLWRVNSDAVGHCEGADMVALELSPEEGGPLVTVSSFMHHFEGRGKEIPWWDRLEAEEFDYGYSLTVHKSQGSQWNNVTLFDESYVFRQNRWKWLYTGITRAAKKIDILRI